MKLFRWYGFTRLGIIANISKPSKWLSAAIYQQENERLSLIDASTRVILNYEAKWIICIIYIYIYMNEERTIFIKTLGALRAPLGFYEYCTLYLIIFLFLDIHFEERRWHRPQTASNRQHVSEYWANSQNVVLGVQNVGWSAQNAAPGLGKAGLSSQNAGL